MKGSTMSDLKTQSGRNEANVMNRSVLTRLLADKLKSEEAVIGGIGNTNFDLWASGQRPQNFYMLGSMGLATPIALGVAIAQPQRKVFALDGDGSILMQLGALGTVAAEASKNLAIIIWDNGLYQITGSQKTLTDSGTDLVAMAKGAGIAQSHWAFDEAHFESLLDRTLSDDGPWFIAARIDGEKPAGTTERDPVKIRLNFMQGLDVKP
jgi:thiamine pyrophosphate-dependent acetolactate synthase large subunit-like protein